MALWRFGRGWSDDEMKHYLTALADRSVGFDVDPDTMTRENGWTVDGIDAEIGFEPPGPPLPDGLFKRCHDALVNYDFSDPRIVEGHFDPHSELVGRNILLEIKVFGLRFLNGARVHSVCDEVGKAGSILGFRYDTLEGHIERGYEWFLLTKNHQTGEIRFKIEAHWKLGDFPNWWSRMGFKIVGERFRELWRREAPFRLKRAAERARVQPAPPPGELAHRGDPRPKRTEPAGTVEGSRS
jgi:uncharacterized protein (UPF0548 family)